MATNKIRIVKKSLMHVNELVCSWLIANMENEIQPRQKYATCKMSASRNPGALFPH